MVLRDRFRNHLNKIRGINFFIKDSLNYSIYLRESNSSWETEVVSTNSFVFLSFICWKNCVIDLSKLFSDSKNDKYSISILLNILDKKCGGEYHKLLNDQSLIVKWREELSKKSSQINAVLYLRDKSYAHLDRNFKSNDLEIDEILDLIEFIDDILKDLYSIIYDEQILNKNFFFNKPRIKEYYVKGLKTEKKLKFLKIIKEVNKRNK